MYILLLVSAALYSLTVVRPFLPVDMYAAYLGLYLQSHPKDIESCWFYFAVVHSLQVMSEVG